GGAAAALLREAGRPASSPQGGARALRLREAQSGYRSALLQDGPHRVPERAHLPGAGVAEARVVGLPLRPQRPRLPAAGGVGDGRALSGLLLRRRQKAEDLREEADLEAVRPEPDQSRSTVREDGARQDREKYGRGRWRSVGPPAGGRPDPPQQIRPRRRPRQ